MTGRDRMVESLCALGHYAFNLPLSHLPGMLVEMHGLIDCPEQAVGIKGFEKKTIASISVYIQIFNRVVNSSCVMCNRECAVYGTYHLGKAAGFI